MSPKIADEQVRDALIEAAARLLAREGPSALTARRLAAQVSTSTMALYTHFGSMDGLRRAVRTECFARLTDYFDSVPVTRDPVADLAALGWAYCFNAVANPQLYRAVFLEPPTDEEDVAVEPPCNSPSTPSPAASRPAALTQPTPNRSPPKRGPPRTG